MDMTCNVMSRLATTRIVSRETQARALNRRILIGWIAAVGWIAGVGLGLSAGCSEGIGGSAAWPAAPGGGLASGTAQQQAGELLALRAAADARRLTAELRSAATTPDPTVRALAVQLVGRLEDEGAVPLLELALADREPGIRLDAARGLARHPALAPAAREATVLAAYAAAPTTTERAELLGVLADVASSAASPALSQGLRAETAEERAAACGSLGRLAERGRAPSPADLEHVVAQLEGAEAGSTERAACATVLATSVARETASEGLRARAVRALEPLAAATNPDLACPAVEALGVLGGPAATARLTALVGSPAARIAVESVRALRRSVGAGPLSALADAELGRLLALPPGPARAARAPVLLELLAALEGWPDHPSVVPVVDRVTRAYARAPVEGEGSHVQRAHALVQCAAARLADGARRWPKDLLTCGGEHVPSALRDTWIAQAFARVPGSDELRAAQLQRLFDKGSAPGQLAVQLAVLEASDSLPVKQAAGLARAGLRSPEPSIVGAAAAAIARRPALRAAPEASELASALVEAASRAAAEPAAAIAWLAGARALVRGGADANGASGGGGAARPAALIERVTRLARHSAPAVHQPARALLREWDALLPEALDPVADALPVDRFPDRNALFHVKLVTTAGPLVLELDTARAPAAAVRFVELSRSGALDGLPVAQLAAGRAVAFTPSPAQPFALRHEDTSRPVERGSVLLQDHGRDALGPGFALILARAPQLDRRTQVIGRITAGLEVADALLPSDLILEAQVQAQARSARP